MAKVYEYLGNGITTNEDLERYIRQNDILRPHFKGIYKIDNLRKLDRINRIMINMKKRDFLIINNNEHWSAIFKCPKNGKICEFDAFNRDLLGNKFQDVKTNDEQKILDEDCGQRTLKAMEEMITKGQIE